MGMFDRRRSCEADGDHRGDYPGKVGDERLYPTLVEFLTLSKFADGGERELGTVRLLSEGGRLKACFNDNAESRYGFVSLDSLEGVPEQLEHALEHQRVDWRPSRDGGASKRR